MHERSARLVEELRSTVDGRARSASSEPEVDLINSTGTIYLYVNIGKELDSNSRQGFGLRSDVRHTFLLRKRKEGVYDTLFLRG